MIEGYEQFGNGGSCAIVVSQAVLEFLKAEKGKSQSAKKQVEKVGQILRYLGEFGLQRMGNPIQFKREGKFPSGRKGKSDIVVYAVKNSQLRVYGGFVNIGGKSVFVCVEAAIKKRDKADQNQLQRVAKAVGAIE